MRRRYGAIGYIALVTSLIFSVLSLSLMSRKRKMGTENLAVVMTFTVLSSFILLYLLAALPWNMFSGIPSAACLS